MLASGTVWGVGFSHEARVGEAVTLLRVEGLTVRYGGALLAVDSISFEVPDGGAVSLLGANGAGKTTVLRAISGLLRFHGGAVTAGRVHFAGRDITGNECSRLVNLGIAQVLEGRRIFADLSVADNLRAGGFVSGRRGDEIRGHVLELFPLLETRMAVAAGLLSGGEQQMLAIGRALMAGPRLLLLDEPSLGLAPLVVRRIGEVLARINRDDGVGLLLVEQSTALAVATTSQAHLLETGRIVKSAATATLVADESVRASYLGTAAGGDLVAAAAE
jgi:ABC-type branched-subunit amino acid transport system ATPase component